MKALSHINGNPRDNRPENLRVVDTRAMDPADNPRTRLKMLIADLEAGHYLDDIALPKATAWADAAALRQVLGLPKATYK